MKTHNLTADRILTKKQAEILLDATREAKDQAIATQKDTKFINDYFLFFIAYHTGLRVSELVDLRWKDIGEDFLLVRNGKGSKKRTVYFGEKTKCELIHFQKVQKEIFSRSCKSGDFLFIGQRGPISRVAAHIRLKYWVERLNLPSSISMHSARHGYATLLLDNGIPLQLVRDQLGHSNISVTSTYLHFTEEAKSRLKKVL